MCQSESAARIQRFDNPYSKEGVGVEYVSHAPERRGIYER